jgi:hypothetical protein
VDTVRRELKEMQDEAERYNNPDTYARYGKIQRQIVQKEKVLQIMVKAKIPAIKPMWGKPMLGKPPSKTPKARLPPKM